MKIVGKGVGSVRHCNFTTGSFVEPITVWDEAKLLKFDVVEHQIRRCCRMFWLNIKHGCLHNCYFKSF
ncbi:MAG: hypothetical protein EBU25_05975 [Burkholderiaceae bacterium]|nr:hypothetical protein [Burkholderiaceae bacterium]